MTVHIAFSIWWVLLGTVYLIGAVCTFPVMALRFMDTRDSAVFLGFLSALIWPLLLIIVATIWLCVQIRGCFP